jgi:hypothetical protein
MIKGGTNAAGKTTGLLCGYVESYLPVRFNLLRADIRAAIERKSGAVVEYVLRSYIRNLTNTAWVEMGTVSYLQLARSANGNDDTATMTVQQPETWSAYLAGGTYEDLLAPSNRTVRIKAGIKLSGVEYLITIYRGHVTGYREAWGASGGSILLQLSDVREIASRVTADTPALTAASRYRLALQASVLARAAVPDGAP